MSNYYRNFCNLNEGIICEYHEINLMNQFKLTVAQNLCKHEAQCTSHGY